MRHRRRQGLTLIEMLVALAVAGVLVALAAPSFSNYIVVQRLKGINAQLVTDLAFARSEAVARGVPVRIRFMPWTSGSGLSCYVVFTVDENVVLNHTARYTRCDCQQSAGPVCGANAEELRTVRVADSSRVFVSPMHGPYFEQLRFDPRNGGMTAVGVDVDAPALDPFKVEAFIDNARKYVDQVGRSGRTSVCIPPGSKMPGTAC